MSGSNSLMSRNSSAWIFHTSLESMGRRLLASINGGGMLSKDGGLVVRSPAVDNNGAVMVNVEVYSNSWR